MSEKTIILWLRRDLRLSDHPAWSEALRSNARIIPVFIWAPHEEKPWAPGAASRWWLHHSLEALSKNLSSMGSKLILRAGDSISVLRSLVAETKANAIYFSRLYEPKIIKRDQEIFDFFKKSEIEVRIFSGHLLIEPEDLKNKQKMPFQVFTPFWKAALEKSWITKETATITRLPPLAKWPTSLALKDFELLPKISWDKNFYKIWEPGEVGARKALNQFLLSAGKDYHEGRDLPAKMGTSRLSPHLHFGELSIREVYNAVEATQKKSTSQAAKISFTTYQKELGWREFAHHLIYHFPFTTNAPLRSNFEKFPWEKNPRHLTAWQNGKTGFAIVDAGMRELWSTGWMHNRVRMIVASFLTKDLRISWLSGAQWFWETLVDADLANNTLGWQWAGGCGADAAPYFRIFNPDSQTEKFDPNFRYIREWIPELKKDLQVVYIKRIVDHKAAREAALAAFQSLKRT